MTTNGKPESTISGLGECIQEALRFLSRDQLPDGGFCTIISSDALLERREFVFPSVFVTALVAHCLSFVRDDLAENMRLKACQHLIAAMTPPGLWTDLDLRRFSNATFDHDLDSTCCASFVIRGLHEGIGAESNVEAILKNRNGEGLFFTWLRKVETPNNVDSIVNANVLLYLGDRPETQAASRYLNSLIKENRVARSSFYYLDEMALYYMISRAAWHAAPTLHACRSPIVEKILAWRGLNGSFGDELHTALAVCALVNLKNWDRAILEEAAASLLTRQQRNGAWQGIAFYAVPEPPAPWDHWFGSEALTTALCVEALARYASTCNAR